MIFKILTFIFTIIKINDGIHDTELDLFFPSSDFLNASPLQEEEIFGKFFDTPVGQINEEIHGESSTAGIQNEPRDENETLQWAQDIFLQEYHQWNERSFMAWDDLRNESYLQSWPFLCYQLWAEHPNTKRGRECSAHIINDVLNPNYAYRVVMPNNKKRYKVDLLKCKCPKNSTIPKKKQTVSNSGLYFFVTPCAAYHNSYYIMRQGRVLSLELYDIRNTTFSPAYDINVLANETNLQTYGQPATTELLIQPNDETAIEKVVHEKFLDEFYSLKEWKFWNDLRNEAYLQSWPVLCYQLWDKHPNVKRGKECSAHIINDVLNPRFNYRVVMPNDKKRYKVNLLKCKCPVNSGIPKKKQTVSYSGLYFFVTPCAAFQNSYYIMREICRSSLEVFDIRNTTFSPAYDINVLANETNLQTYGQPGATGILIEPKDETEIQKVVQKKFLDEFYSPEEWKFWDDLRNEAYENSWPTLCFLLLDIETRKRTGEGCNTTILHVSRHLEMRQRVEDPTVPGERMYADLLICKCHKSVDFYVTKSFTEHNSYYIMRSTRNQGSTLEVYDLRSVNFKPGFIP